MTLIGKHMRVFSHRILIEILSINKSNWIGEGK